MRTERKRRGRVRRMLARALTVTLLTPLVSLALVGIGSTASPWNVDISSVTRTGFVITVAGTAYSPAGQASGNYLEIAWGDGATQTLPNFLGQGPWNWGPLSHTYAAEGNYTITATLLHASPNGNDRNAFDTAVIVIPEPGDPEPDEVDVQVSLGQCETDGTSSSTPVVVAFTGDGEATVAVRDGDDALVATFSGSGSEDLSPGSYSYTVVAAEGSELAATSDTGDELLVTDCTPVVGAQGSVAVSLGACDYVDDESTTPLTTTIAPAGAATVFVSAGDEVIATFTGSGGSMDLPVGDYVWTATPSEGFELTGPVAGTATATDCPPLVLGDPPLNRDTLHPQLPAQLPKTGPSALTVVAAGMLLGVAGAWFNVVQRRAEARI